jgi:hypothetical protein
LFFLLQLADLSYRIGDAPAAAEHYRAARELAARMRPLANGHPDLDLPAVGALEEAERLEEAESLLRSKLLPQAEPPLELVAEASSRLAVLAARLGDCAAAERWASRASEAAMEVGHRHCLVRTAVHLGRASRLLDRRDDAVELLRWASSLCEAQKDPASVGADDELLLLVELDRCGALGPERVEPCLRLVPDSLAAASPWWALYDVLSLWLRHGGSIQPADGPGLAKALRVLLTAGRAREDCRPLVPAASELSHRLGFAAGGEGQPASAASPETHRAKIHRNDFG